jgi:hypothetical protein
VIEELYSDPTPVQHQHIRGGTLRGRDLGQVSVPIHRPTALDPSTSWSFFHPSRVDARFAPAEFRSQVKALDPNLDVVWHPIHQRWCVWVRNPKIRHRLCPGWQMLFPVRYADGSFMPLDERTLAAIYDRSARKWGNGIQYWNRIQDEIRHDYVQGQRNRSEFIGQQARDRWAYAQIKVGYGASNGSKFQKHHSGN